MAGPFGKTYPLQPAVVRIADGVGRRSSHVYAQAWLRGVQAIRGLLPALVTVGSRGLAEAEAEIAAADRDVTTPVGRGRGSEQAADPLTC